VFLCLLLFIGYRPQKVGHHVSRDHCQQCVPFLAERGQEAREKSRADNHGRIRGQNNWAHFVCVVLERVHDAALAARDAAEKEEEEHVVDELHAHGHAEEPEHIELREEEWINNNRQHDSDDDGEDVGENGAETVHVVPFSQRFGPERADDEHPNDNEVDQDGGRDEGQEIGGLVETRNIYKKHYRLL